MYEVFSYIMFVIFSNNSSLYKGSYGCMLILPSAMLLDFLNVFIILFHCFEFSRYIITNLQIIVISMEIFNFFRYRASPKLFCPLPPNPSVMDTEAVSSTSIPSSKCYLNFSFTMPAQSMCF